MRLLERKTVMNVYYIYYRLDDGKLYREEFTAKNPTSAKFGFINLAAEINTFPKVEKVVFKNKGWV
jgi:hypothetical protein